MSTIKHVIVLGAGPCGLSTAIALAKSSAPDPSLPSLRITLIELRPSLQTIGGTVNMTPLGMRYLDYLGAGDKVRSQSMSIDTGVDYISTRFGFRLGSAWGGIGAHRVARYTLVKSMHDALTENHSDTVKIQWGRRVAGIIETEGKVVLEFDDHSTLQCDLLLGCDGIHSVARLLYVEPERKRFYAGRAAAMGWIKDLPSNDPPVTFHNGESALRDTAVYKRDRNAMIATYYEPSRRNVFLAHVVWAEEEKIGGRDGWKVSEEDRAAVSRQVMEAYKDSKLHGLEELIAKCESWQFYPINSLPPDGRWHRGRVLLLGDAAHAMPPQGESTGICIEDGILLAKVFERRGSRSLDQMLTDYEALRRKEIAKHFARAQRFAQVGFANTSGLTSILMEAFMAIYMLMLRLTQNNHFAGDVRDLELPA